jgi:hypothetical protein
MKVVIAGSRTIHHSHPYHRAKLETAIKKFELEHGKITIVVSGRATGPDLLGEQWAKDNRAHVAEFPAMWDLHGKASGIVRNVEMADFADGGIVLWDGVSRGTKHMLKQLKERHMPYILDIFEPMVYKTTTHLPSGQIVSNTLTKFLDDPAYD